MVLESNYLIDYSTLYELLKMPNSLDKKKIILFSCDAVRELEEIGVDYCDLHSKNVMVKGTKIKITDLNEAISDPLKQCFDLHDYQFMDFILGCYLFYDFDNSVHYSDILLRLPNVHYYFSKSLVHHLIAVNNLERGVLSVEDYIDEFEDAEKISKIRMELKKVLK